MREIIVGDGGRSRAADLAGEAEIDDAGVVADEAAPFPAGVDAVFFVRLDMVLTLIVASDKKKTKIRV
jgi:hypothetical protein